ncbi:T9SS type A sorting domain-containing protein [uncultured Imperialibacter sp.]|uniref:T9SS type A sorting domain-containing protein n=1 Tax=uncultured Imperialibacter sp. TaxID=1672639 RepID=UPI0030D8A7D5|tara:strand:- start:5288 stop:7417 length:2130 start_codon:yes stop_codon:yes gene_type:complete
MKKLLLIAAIISPFCSFGQQFDYYGPAPFSEVLNQSFSQNWTPQAVSAVQNRAYLVVMDESKEHVVMLGADDVYTLSLADVNSFHGSSATYGSLLRGIFQAVDINTHENNGQTPLAGQYRLNPFLHSYYSIDADSEGKAVCADAGTLQIEESAEKGYVVVTFTGNTTAAKIKAVNQWEYNAAQGGLAAVTGWTEKWLQINSGALVWTADEGNASSFFIADANDVIDLEIADGSDFNPLSVSYQPNATAELPDNVFLIDDTRLPTDLSERVDEKYQAQFGNTPDAAHAAETQLDEIETTLTNNGASLRYPKAFYLALRENMLSQKIASYDIYGARLGYNNILNVYFTNALDNNNVPHPFMVVVSFAVSSRPNMLIDVNRPPGADPGVGYAESTVTRHGKLGDFVLKIPLKDYGLVDDVLDNDLGPYGDLASAFDSDHGTTTEKNVYNYVGLASVGLAVDGVTIYPAMNNNIRFTVEDGEITQSGIHVGGGLELHYHADGHAYNRNGINLYNGADYEGHDHPPVIGIAYDGVALFGRYEEDYPFMVGNSVALDAFGGHDHGDDFGYHYHAHTREEQSSANPGVTFEEHFLLVGAWRGNINSIPGFDEGKVNQFDDASIARYAGAPYEMGEVLSVAELRAEQLYPNPTTGQLNILTGQAYRLALYDMAGRLRWIGGTNGDVTSLELGHMEKGTYVLKGFNHATSFVRKVIIE